MTLHPHQTIDWGTLPYDQALDRQRKAVAARKANAAPDRLFFVEHPPVFTIGARANAAQHLLWSPAECQSHGVTVQPSNRGGDITYHGPGQLVGYPVISIAHSKDLHAYLRDLESVLINALATFAIHATRRQGLTGIWLQNRKIAAIGVAVQSWITYHGFALNLNPNLHHFSGIIPCGLHNAAVTSIHNESPSPPTMPQLKAAVSNAFWNTFNPH